MAVPSPSAIEMKDGKIAVVEDEAERVRLIYRRYIELGGVNALVRDLRTRDIRTKSRLLATGATRGGMLFGRGSLFYLLRNRFYVGEVKYKDEILPGEQPAIMDRTLFDAVQQKLTDQWSTRSTSRTANDHLLAGLLFDDAGHRMVPTHATKLASAIAIMFRFRTFMENQNRISRIDLPRFGEPISKMLVVKSPRQSPHSSKEETQTSASHA